MVSWGDKDEAPCRELLAPQNDRFGADYGRVISFYVRLYRATDNSKYLDLARQVAQDAVNKLYVETELARVPSITRAT